MHTPVFFLLPAGLIVVYDYFLIKFRVILSVFLCEGDSRSGMLIQKSRHKILQIISPNNTLLAQLVDMLFYELDKHYT